MTRQDIRDYISYWLKSDGYGRGYKYECYLNGEFVREGLSYLKKVAQEGDTVRINVVAGHQHYRWGGYQVDKFIFDIENERRPIELVRKWRSKKDVTYDFQKSRTYAWERAAVEGFRDDKITLDAARKLLDTMFDKLGLSVPKIKLDPRRSRTCSYYGWVHEIRMAEWGLTVPIVIHEAAHAVVNKLGASGNVSAHGPLYVRVYIDMLVEFGGYDKDHLEQTAKERGLKFVKSFDINGWKDREVIKDSDFERLRNPIELNEKQEQTLLDIGNGKTVDGRSARALINRGLAIKSDGGYELTMEGLDYATA